MRFFKYTLMVFLAAGVIAGVFVLSGQFDVSEPIAPNIVISVRGGRILAERAQTEPERVRGLSGRVSLAPDAGLLFVFDVSGQHGIWMKDMRFPIDIIWIGEQRRIVTIAERVSPDTYPKVFLPETDARYVLEVNAGYAAAHDLHVGDPVFF